MFPKIPMINKRLWNKWISVKWYKLPCPKKTEEMKPDQLYKSPFLSVFYKVKRSIVRLSRVLLSNVTFGIIVNAVQQYSRV